MSNTAVLFPEQTTDDLCNDTAFATVPLPAFKPLFQQPNEEELHTAFEQAISDRQLAVSVRLRRISGPLTTGPLTGAALAPITRPQPAPVSIQRRAWNWTRCRRALLFTCGAAMLLMIGFDLAALLLLATR